MSIHSFIIIIIININKTHIFQVTKKTLIFIQVIISDIIMLVDIWAQKTDHFRNCINNNNSDKEHFSMYEIYIYKILTRNTQTKLYQTLNR